VKPELVITGAGVVSAIGVGKVANLDSLTHVRSGVAPVRYLATSLKDFPVGEVPLSNSELSALCGAPSEWPRTTLLSICALQEALQQAGLDDGSGMRLIGGTTVGGMDLTEKIFPKYSPHHGCGASTDLAALFVGGFEDATTLSTACSSAANAFMFGANLLRTGQYERVVVGGSESLSNYHLNGFNSLMILDREPCRPFDATRAGLNLGEGAAYLVLETLESALKRGAKPLARLSGFGNACDAFHQTASSENGEGAYLAMRKALQMAGLQPSRIDYVNAHGTGTPNNDASESTALKRIFDGKLPPVSSTKAFTGHTTSASGSIEAVFCLLALQQGFIPPQLNYSTPDPACVTPCTSALQKPLKHILSNAFGFGGNDSSIILSAYE
jgi:3-oxoacyl-[acyl-carrier-protein] synthase-1